jgi:chorismate dehydratase
MADRKYKIVMVNYLNSKPFEFGLMNSEAKDIFEICAANPAQCAAAIQNDKADIALIPVGALLDMSDYQIITPYCIGCDGDVRTVCLMSHQPINECKTLVLDDHSRTSFLLSQILIREVFKKDIPIKKADVQHYQPQDGDIILMIGDKVFDREKDFKYNYDLGALWKEMTGLPFVFAVWITKSHIETDAIDLLNDAFDTGIKNLDEVIAKESSENLDLYFYFHHNISYDLDDKKQAALKLFFEKTATLLNKSATTSDNKSEI